MKLRVGSRAWESKNRVAQNWSKINKGKKEEVDLNFTTNTKESSIIKGGSNGYMDEVKLNNLNNFQNIINSQESIPLTNGGSILWDEGKGAYVNSNSGYVFKNKKELLEVMFFGNEKGEFSDDYLQSKNYTGIKDWSYKSTAETKAQADKEFATYTRSIIGSGNEEQVVANFNSDERFSGYTFTTEWELGGRAMNISNGKEEVIIMLDKPDAWEKIQKFMSENKKQLK